MSIERIILILLMGLPGIVFWIHLFIWEKVWDQTHGENWWPVLIQFGLGGLSLIFLLFCVVSAIVQRAKKRRSFELWIAALINVSPVMLPVFMKAYLVMSEIFLNH